MKCMSCLLVMLCHTTLFAIKQLVVYSECNINANILFIKETETITYVKYNNNKKLIIVTPSKSDQSYFN